MAEELGFWQLLERVGLKLQELPNASGIDIAAFLVIIGFMMMFVMLLSVACCCHCCCGRSRRKTSP